MLYRSQMCAAPSELLVWPIECGHLNMVPFKVGHNVLLQQEARGPVFNHTAGLRWD